MGSMIYISKRDYRSSEDFRWEFFRGIFSNTSKRGD